MPIKLYLQKRGWPMSLSDEPCMSPENPNTILKQQPKYSSPGWSGARANRGHTQTADCPCIAAWVSVLCIDGKRHGVFQEDFHLVANIFREDRSINP